MKTRLILSEIAFIAVGLLCACVSVFNLFKVQSDVKTYSVHTDGTVANVTSFVVHDDDRDKTYYNYDVYYRTEDGAERSFHLERKSGQKKEGQHVDVYCTPDWSDAILDTFSARRVGSVIGILFGAVFAGVGGIALRKIRKNHADPYY